MRRALLPVVLGLAMVVIAGCSHPDRQATPLRTTPAYHFRVVNDWTAPVTILQCRGPCRVRTVRAAGSTSLRCDAACRAHVTTAFALDRSRTRSVTITAEQRAVFIVLDGPEQVLGCLPIVPPHPTSGVPTVRVSGAARCTIRTHKHGLVTRIRHWLHL